MKSIRLYVTVAVLLLGVALPSVAQELPPDVVMTVNEQPVYSWEMSLIMPQIQSEMARQGQNPTQDSVSQAALQQIVQVRLIAQEARRREVAVDDAMVDQTMNQIIEQAGGKENLEGILSQFGVGLSDLRSNVAESVLVQHFVENRIESSVTVSPEEVDAFYAENTSMFAQPEQVHARHILFTATADSPQEDRDAARASATAARERALAGEDFAELAKELSQGPSGPTGGDLGFFARDRMVKPFADAAFNLDVGEISVVVETQFGFHVIKVEERRAASTMSIEESREPVEQMLRENRAGQEMNTLLQGLFASAKIVEREAPAANAPASEAGEQNNGS